jgi:ABC-2 type transport system permease protein
MGLNIALPVVILVITGLHGGQKTTNGFGAAAFDIGLALAYGLMSSSLIGYSLTIARDREAGVFQRLRVTPAPTWAIMSSRIVVQIVLDIIMTVIVLIVGGIIHNQAFTLAEYLLVRSAAVVNALGRILYVVFLLLGLLGSSGILGTTVKDISAWTPAGAIINIYGGVLSLAQWSSLDTQGLIAMIIYIVVGAFVGIRWFRWDAR